jgi:hypothetical protein
LFNPVAEGSATGFFAFGMLAKPNKMNYRIMSCGTRAAMA